MRFTKDSATGAALIGLGVVMALVARTFPSIGGMTFGPDLFPTIIACGLILSGVGVLIEAKRGTFETSFEETPSDPIRIGGVLLTIAFFALSMNMLGFHIAAAISFLAAAKLFGGSWPLAIIMAVIGPVLLHFIFYSVMRVPLPWGLLLPVAW